MNFDRYMDFDQLGRQNVSKRRKPSPLRNARHSPASFDTTFPQRVWPRPKYACDNDRQGTDKGKRRSGFSIPESWLKNIAVAAGLLVIGIVGPNWEKISSSFRAREISIHSLEDPRLPPDLQQAGIWPELPLIYETYDTNTTGVFNDIPLNLTETFSWFEYEVEPGDTISGLAAKFSLNMGSIIAFNDLKEAWNLRIGRKLKIPNMDGIRYTIQVNDTLSGIAAKMKAPENVILDANDIQSSIIRPGEVIFIPNARMDANEFNRAIRRDTGRQRATERTMIYPVPGRITSGYGWRLDPVKPSSGVTRLHHAIDLSGNLGDSVKAAMRGTVLNVTNNPNLGNFVILGHGEYQTLYAHLSAFSVRIGDTVEQGQEIGKVGKTGYTTGPHLHFEVFRNGKRINPLDILR